jgi:zinc protease
MLVTSGLDRSYIDSYVDSINKVTAKQVRKVAQKYLVDTNLTVAVLEPQPFGKQPRPRAKLPGGAHVH